MITFLSDFGTADYFVPAVKGAIISLAPAASIIDITHQIPAQDIAEGAFILGACYRNFPAGTIHLAVVDPGVGSDRRPIIVDAADQYFVGPDNGLFSYLYLAEDSFQVFHANRPQFFHPSPSPTFHGRDVFARLAAALASGVPIEQLGSRIHDPVRLAIRTPVIEGEWILGEVIHIDHFGNCITNLTAKDFQWNNGELLLGTTPVRQAGTHFAEAGDKAEPFAYPGSAGYWEVGLWQASLAERYGIKRGTSVRAKKD